VIAVAHPTLFDPEDVGVTQGVLREEEDFGYMDATTGMSLRSYYSDQLSGERLDAYLRGYARGVAEVRKRAD
jgi:hypothetical protein